jgi:hypothetical protein
MEGTIPAPPPRACKECDIVGGSVKFPTKKLVDGQKWKIKNGEAKPN